MLFRLCIILLIALLPLRGVAGDLMRVQWAAGQGATGVEATMPPGCPMHASAETAEADPVPGTTGSALSACESCELCMPLLELVSRRVDTSRLAGHAPHGLPHTSFVSATPVPGFKPPIF